MVSELNRLNHLNNEILYDNFVHRAAKSDVEVAFPINLKQEILKRQAITNGKGSLPTTEHGIPRFNFQFCLQSEC